MMTNMAARQVSQPMVRHVRSLEDFWNRKDVEGIAQMSAVDCHWRNRVTSFWGREQIRQAIERQCRRELQARLIMEPWAEGARRLSIRLAGEFRNDSGTWFRVYGTEDVEFDEAGRVRRRLTSINEHPIDDHQRVLHWPSGPRPVEHPTLTELGF